MTKTKEQNKDTEKSLEELMLGCTKDRYKMSYAALRWAKEIKQKENLPDLIAVLLPRAMRDLLTGKVTLKEIEKMPVNVKITQPIAPAPAAAAASAPAQTITLNVPAEEGKEEKPEAAEKVEAKAEAKEEVKEEAKEEAAAPAEEKKEEK